MAALMEMDDLVEAFLLRLPPDDPASLVRAALVCKPWRRILADRGFRRRFRDFHRTPRLLGVIHRSGYDAAAPCLVPISAAFRPRNADLRGRTVLDSRHGRVLLDVNKSSGSRMAVWDPVTGEKLRLPWLQLPQEPNHIICLLSWNGAVLCASCWNSSFCCDHHDCHGSHFMVVFIGSSLHHGLYVYVYSSEAGSWTLTASAAQNPNHRFFLCHYEPGTLAGSALHFMVQVKPKIRICKYDLGIPEISWIELPPSCSHWRCRVLLTSTQYGELGCAKLENSRLHLWSREAGSDGLLGWVQSRVIELETVLPSNSRLTSLAAFVHGVGVLLVATDDGLFSIDLESNRVAKVCEGREINNVVPYVSLCIPALGTAFTREEPSAGVSSA